MAELQLSLDYDNIGVTQIFRELFKLKHRFGVGLELFRSSEDSFHIKSKDYINKQLAFKILEFARCSPAYKDFCRERGCFPIRLSSKVIRKDGEVVEVKDPPFKIYEV